jgi:hypothetical protein
MTSLKIGDKVLYFKQTCELVTILKVHQDDPSEPYFTIQLQNGTEKQTVKKYLGNYSFFPFKKENIFDEEFWDFKQLIINNKFYAYSRTTRLILELFIEDEGEEYSNRAFKLFGIRGEGDKIIRGKKIPVEILKWSLKQKIQVFKNKPLFWF